MSENKKLEEFEGFGLPNPVPGVGIFDLPLPGQAVAEPVINTAPIEVDEELKNAIALQVAQLQKPIPQAAHEVPDFGIDGNFESFTI